MSQAWDDGSRRVVPVADGCMSEGCRARFWSRVRGVVDGPLSWPDRFARLEELVASYDAGWDLVRSPARADCVDPNGIAPPLPESVVGYRAFLIDWTAGARTQIHGHPSVMFVYPISARLEAVEYVLVDGRPEPQQTRMHGPGQSMTGWADNNRHDNFIHRLRCVDGGWSLHIYSDHGGRGPRFGEADGAPPA